MARLLFEAIEPLGGKLGAVLLQFPPRFTAERAEELAAFLDRLTPAPRLSVEFRHASWESTETESLLRSRAVCWVASDDAPRHVITGQEERANARLSRRIAPTADFLYIRWLGKHGQFPHRRKEHFDPSPRLRWWSQRLREVLDRQPEVKDVYGFFDNDFAGHAPASAKRLMEILGLAPPAPEAPQNDEPTLFG
jgi:uncharacterized protein YecE (DUF72 family)